MTSNPNQDDQYNIVYQKWMTILASCTVIDDRTKEKYPLDHLAQIAIAAVCTEPANRETIIATYPEPIKDALHEVHRLAYLDSAEILTPAFLLFSKHGKVFLEFVDNDTPLTEYWVSHATNTRNIPIKILLGATVDEVGKFVDDLVVVITVKHSGSSAFRPLVSSVIGTRLIPVGENLNFRHQCEYITEDFIPSFSPNPCYSLKLLDLATLCKCPQVPLTIKALSVMVSFFPDASGEIRHKLTIYDRDQAYNNYIQLRSLNSQVRGLPQSQQFLLCVTVITATSYSQLSKIHGQVLKRIRAMAATIGANIPDTFIDDIKSVITETAQLSGDGRELAGRIVARNKENIYDPYVTEANMISGTELAICWHLPESSFRLFSVLRLILRNFATQSLTFTFATMTEVATSQMKDLPKIANQLVAMKALEEKMGNSPYAGLQSEIPADQEIKANPELIYLCLTIYSNYMVNELKDENFSEYNLSSIKGHVTDVKTLHMLECASKIVSSPGVYIFALVISKLDAAAATRELDRLRATHDTNVIQNLLLTNYQNCAWSLAYKAATEAEKAKAALVQVIKKLESKIKATKDRIDEARSEATDVAESERLKQLRKTLNRTSAQLIDDLTITQEDDNMIDVIQCCESLRSKVSVITELQNLLSTINKSIIASEDQ